MPIQDANALYANAINTLHQTPEAIANLGPVATAAFDAARGVVLQIGEEVLTEVGQMILTEVLEEIGPVLAAQLVGVVGGVAGAVAGVVPVIGFVVSLVSMAMDAQAAGDDERARQEAALCNEASTHGITGTGAPGGFITPADIFALNLDTTYHADYPNSSLGMAIVAITEGFGPLPGDPAKAAERAQDRASGYSVGVDDNPLRHANEVLEPSGMWTYPPGYSMPGHFAHLMQSHGPRPEHAAVGIPYAVRQQLQALRRAIGSYGEDRGLSLWPIYLDLILHEIDVGHLTLDYMRWLPRVYFRDPNIYGPFGSEFGIVSDKSHNPTMGSDGYPGPFCADKGAGGLGAMDPYVMQFVGILQQWRETRDDPELLASLPDPSKVKRTLAATLQARGAQGQAAKLRRELARTITQRKLTPTPRLAFRQALAHRLPKRTAAEQAAIDAYAASLGLPPGNF